MTDKLIDEIDHSIGIEVECFMPYKNIKVPNYWYGREPLGLRECPREPKYIIESNMYDIRDNLERELLDLCCFERAEVDNDGSIKPKKGTDSAEVKVMFRQSQAKTAIKTLCDKLAEYKAQVNSSCGLHVHLDCRNRNPDEVYEKLIRSQDYMRKLVTKNRLRNHYCKHVSLPQHKNDRYRAVNYEAIREHQTIEVRLHHGSVDFDEIYPWVQLLLNILDAPLPKRKPRVLKSAVAAYKLTPQMQHLLEAKANKAKTAAGGKR